MQEIKSVNPDLLNQRIQRWDDMEFRKLQTFATEKYWQDSSSINVFRVVGTQHPDYGGWTWLDFLQGGKRMGLNLSLLRDNPGYYYDTTRKQPTMFFHSLDGGDMYIGGDGNHRTCIAKALFYLNGDSMIHGVSLTDWRIDWALKKAFDELIALTVQKGLPFFIEAVQETMDRDDSSGWMREKYKPGVRVYDTKRNKRYLFTTSSEIMELLSSSHSRTTGRKILSFFSKR